MPLPARSSLLLLLLMMMHAAASPLQLLHPRQHFVLADACCVQRVAAGYLLCFRRAVREQPAEHAAKRDKENRQVAAAVVRLFPNPSFPQDNQPQQVSGNGSRSLLAVSLASDVLSANSLQYKTSKKKTETSADDSSSCARLQDTAAPVAAGYLLCFRRAVSKQPAAQKPAARR
jgi:hypothetical protein